MTGSFAPGSAVFGHGVLLSGALDSASLFGSAFVFACGSGRIGFAFSLVRPPGSVLAFGHRSGLSSFDLVSPLSFGLSSVLGSVLCGSGLCCSGLVSALPFGLSSVLGSALFGSGLSSFDLIFLPPSGLGSVCFYPPLGSPGASSDFG